MSKDELNTLLEHLTLSHRMREDLMKPRVALGNQMTKLIKTAKGRGFEITKTDFAIDPNAEPSEKEKDFTISMVEIAKQLPVHSWWCNITGCNSLGLAAIIAETGDLSKYANPGKVWKRMGLDVINGEANKNQFGATGYSKRRRMIAYRSTNSIIMHNKDYYRKVFDERKQLETERDLTGYNKEYVEKHKTWMLRTYTTSKKKLLEGRLPQCVINNRAHRYMTKRLIKDLWIEWTKELGVVEVE